MNRIMKRLSKVFVALAMVLSLTSVDVFAVPGINAYASLKEGVEATSSDWEWDEVNCILTITEDLVVTGYDYGFHFDMGGTGTAKIVLDDANLTISALGTGIYCYGNLEISGTGNLTIAQSEEYGIMSNECEIILDGDVKISGDNYGIYSDDLSVKCYSLEVGASNYSAISAGPITLNTSGDIVIETKSTITDHAAIYTWNDVTITSEGDVKIIAENSVGICLSPDSSNTVDITFDVDGETNINAVTPIYLANRFYEDGCSTTIFNNGSTIYLNAADGGGGSSIDTNPYYDSGEYKYEYYLVLQGSGEIFADGGIYASSLSVEDEIVLNADGGIEVDNTLYIGPDATVDTIGILGNTYEIEGVLSTGLLFGGNLYIVDGATVIVDQEKAGESSYSYFPIAFGLNQDDGEGIKCLHMGDNIVVYTLEDTADFVLTKRVEESGDDEVFEYYLLTATTDGREFEIDMQDWSSNAVTYIMFATEYNIDVTVKGEGSVTPDTSSVIKGEDVTYEFTPEEGYEISDVLVDEESVGVVTSYTFEGVASDHTLEVVFSEIVEDEVVGGTDPEVDDEDDTDLGGDVETDPEADVDTEVEDETPDTSDASGVVFFLVAGSMSLAYLYYDLKKKQRA